MLIVSACQYSRDGQWSECTDGIKSMTKTLQPGSDEGCEATKTITKQCGGGNSEDGGASRADRKAARKEARKERRRNERREERQNNREGRKNNRGERRKNGKNGDAAAADTAE